MATVYLCAKMRGVKNQNREAFRSWAKRLRARGLRVVSPVELDEADPLPKNATTADYAERDLPHAMACDGIALLGDIATSECGRIEVVVAKVMGKCIAPAEAWEKSEAFPWESLASTMVSRSETRVTDPKTGARKGVKMARFSLLPWDVLWQVAEHYQRGVQAGYEERNWEKGATWSVVFDALHRHLSLWWMGENMDIGATETHAHHLDAVIFWAMALRRYALRGVGTDDRPISRKPA
jgi:hypothetical protein